MKEIPHPETRVPGSKSLPESAAPVVAAAAKPAGSAAESAVAGAETGKFLAVVGVFLAVVAIGMLVGQWVQPREEPWRSPVLNEAKQQLQAKPKDEALKARIRELDLELRRNYFRGLQRDRTGAWLLLVAGVGLVLFGRGVVGRPMAHPRNVPVGGPDREATVRFAQRGVVVLGVAGAAGLAVMGMASRSRLPEFAAARPGTGQGQGMGTETNVAAVAAGGASRTPAGMDSAEAAKQWPRFRGPLGDGTVAAIRLPESWDVASGQGVVWKSPVPLAGYNSPVAWGEHVFLSGGDREQRKVFCFDAASGALRWERGVMSTNAAAAADVPDQSGAAASTVAVDGQRVFAVFANGELGALDFAGNPVWSKRLNFADNGYGHASSLVVWRDRLLVQADQGQADGGRSALYAYDVATGAVVWTARRPVGGSWATPLVVGVGDSAQVITAGDPWLMAHDAGSGAEIWRAKVLGGELAPSPVVAGGLVIAISPGKALSAVKFGATGEVTSSQVAWRIDQEVPDVPSPVVVGDSLVTVNTEGHVFRRELATGKKTGELALELEFQASPLVVGRRLYLFSQPGDVVIVEVGDELKEVGRFKMGEEVYASPAVLGDRLLVRTQKTLYCLGEKAGPTKEADAR